MNKWLLYVLGIITGVILTFVFAFLASGPHDAEMVEPEIFDKPGDCVSPNDFEVQEVLESGNALALEIIDNISGRAVTGDLEVLILAKEGDHFYNKQIVKAPQGKCARQIGNYKYQHYSNTKVIPVIEFQ